jgi:hypothetical protein
MGRDFSIGCSDSTCKGVSYIMFKMIKCISQISDDVDDISHENKCISVEQLAIIIKSLKDDLDFFKYNNDSKEKFVESYKFYKDETFEIVHEHVVSAYMLFVDALVDAILNKENKVYWNYS